jgi:hypothetical protein
MQIDVSSKGTVIDIQFYTNQMLEGMDVPIRALIIRN